VSKYPDTSYGGVIAGQAHGAVIMSPTRLRGVPADTRIVVGGADWEGAPPICTRKMKDTGWPCDHEAIKGKDHCLGHSRGAQKGS